MPVSSMITFSIVEHAEIACSFQFTLHPIWVHIRASHSRALFLLQQAGVFAKFRLVPLLTACPWVVVVAAPKKF